MSEPRIVTPEEAQASLPDASTMGLFEWRLAHTVATEPDRIRAAVVEALRDAAQGNMQWVAEPVEWLMNRADAIENGADL